MGLLVNLNIPVLVFALVAISLIYRYIVYPAFLSPLSKIPAAHWTSHFLPLWISYIRYMNRENKTIFRLHQEKGPILRLGPNDLSVNCYEGGLKTVYTGGFPKNDFYANRFTNYGTTNMFSMVNSKEHSTRKRMLSNVYSKSYVLASPTTREATRSVLYDRLLPIYQDSAVKGTAIEMLELNYAYSMDAFMTYQFGLRYGSNFIQDTQKRQWYLNLFFSRRPYLYWVTEAPKFANRLSKLLGIRLIPKWVDEATYHLESWNLDICDKAERLLSETDEISPGDYPVIYAQERKAMRSTYPDVVKSYSSSPGGIYPFRYQIASDMYDHNAAAHETSGDTLTYVYYEMSRRPELQKRLREELMSLDAPILYRPPENGPQNLPDPKKVDSLPLLDAVLMETLRLWVAVPGGQPRLTPFPPCSLAGYDNIPPNVRVQAYAYALHRNPEVFPDPEAWNPERWMEASPEKLSEMRKWFWAFGSGGRMCIGNHIAIHSMKHNIAAAYTNYTTTIYEHGSMDLAEGFTAGPEGNRLSIVFHHV